MKKVNEGQIKIGFNAPLEKEHKNYEDKFPNDLPTLEEVKAQYGKVVWCQYTKCRFNEAVKGLQRTSGTILKNRMYSPINEQEHIWDSICTRDEIGIRFDTTITSGGIKIKVPSCFTAISGVSGHQDWSRLLQGDGSPFGGNVDSQNTLNRGY